MSNQSNGNGKTWWGSLWSRSQPAVDLSAYRRVAMQLHHDLPRGESSRTVLLTSANPSGAVAQASMLLAQSVSEQIQRPVLLIDAATQDARVSRLLGCAASPGFVDVVAEPEMFSSDLLLPTSHPGVSFMPAGSSKAVVLAGENLEAVMRRAESQFDFVVFAGGAVLADPRTLALAPAVGCVLLLAHENQTRIEDLDSAQDSLTFCKARKVGLLFTMGSAIEG